jgi:hypothetical protein
LSNTGIFLTYEKFALGKHVPNDGWNLIGAGVIFLPFVQRVDPAAAFLKRGGKGNSGVLKHPAIQTGMVDFNARPDIITSSCRWLTTDVRTGG